MAALPEPMPIYVENTRRDTSNLDEFVEIRTDGPEFTKHDQTLWRLEYTVNILVVANITDDMFRMERRLGEIQGIMPQTFPVVDGDVTTAPTLFCMTAMTRRNGTTHEVTRLNIIQRHMDRQEASVEITYYGHAQHGNL